LRPLDLTNLPTNMLHNQGKMKASNRSSASTTSKGSNGEEGTVKVEDGVKALAILDSATKTKKSKTHSNGELIQPDSRNQANTSRQDGSDRQDQITSSNDDITMAALFQRMMAMEGKMNGMQGEMNGMKKEVARIPGLEEEVATIPGLKKEVARIPELEKDIKTLKAAKKGAEIEASFQKKIVSRLQEHNYYLQEQVSQTQEHNYYLQEHVSQTEADIHHLYSIQQATTKREIAVSADEEIVIKYKLKFPKLEGKTLRDCHGFLQRGNNWKIVLDSDSRQPGLPLESLFDYCLVIDRIKHERNQIAHKQYEGHRTVSVQSIFKSMMDVTPPGYRQAAEQTFNEISQKIPVSPQHHPGQAFVFPSSS